MSHRAIRPTLAAAILVITLSLLGDDSKQKEGSVSKQKTNLLRIQPTIDGLQIEPAIDSIQVDARLDPNNPAVVTVVVDLTKLSVLQRIRNLSVPVQFLDLKGKAIATEKYQFTDKSIPVLQGGKKYQRSFEHSVKTFNLANGKLKTLPAQVVVEPHFDVVLKEGTFPPQDRI